jgi:hypothetical protein
MFVKKDARKAYEEYGEANKSRIIAHIEWFKYPNQETADKARGSQELPLLNKRLEGAVWAAVQRIPRSTSLEAIQRDGPSR